MSETPKNGTDHKLPPEAAAVIRETTEQIRIHRIALEERLGGQIDMAARMMGLPQIPGGYRLSPDGAALVVGPQQQTGGAE